ncbi:hypothetical protein FKM82_002256 [Ascaphus truei]
MTPYSSTQLNNVSKLYQPGNPNLVFPHINYKIPNVAVPYVMYLHFTTAVIGGFCTKIIFGTFVPKF